MSVRNGREVFKDLVFDSKISLVQIDLFENATMEAQFANSTIEYIMQLYALPNESDMQQVV